MFRVTINIDPHNSMDFEEALKFILDQPCMSKQREAYKQITSNPSQWVNKTELEKLITENNELKNIIKSKEIENERKDSFLKEKLYVYEASISCDISSNSLDCILSLFRPLLQLWKLRTRAPAKRIFDK